MQVSMRTTGESYRIGKGLRNLVKEDHQPVYERFDDALEALQSAKTQNTVASAHTKALVELRHLEAVVKEISTMAASVLEIGKSVEAAINAIENGFNVDAGQLPDSIAKAVAHLAVHGDDVTKRRAVNELRIVLDTLTTEGIGLEQQFRVEKDLLNMLTKKVEFRVLKQSYDNRLREEVEINNSERGYRTLSIQYAQKGEVDMSARYRQLADRDEEAVHTEFKAITEQAQQAFLDAREAYRERHYG